jgi:hypothetical protein
MLERALKNIKKASKRHKTPSGASCRHLPDTPVYKSIPLARTYECSRTFSEQLE